MTFEFVVAYRRQEEIDIHDIIVEILARVLEDNLNEFPWDQVDYMIRSRCERLCTEATDENDNTFRNILFGFTLELPEETAQIDSVLKEFTQALLDTPPLVHAVKFEDPLLRDYLVQRANEIYALEMKLRRVLTLIYLHACRNSDPYDLLRDEMVQPMSKERPKPDHMKAVAENQFFHLTFSQYVSLNQRPEFKLPTLMQLISSSESFDSLHAELNRRPVEHEEDAQLLSGLKSRMDAIETMRNCVAHNRHPTRSALENYDNALPLLEELLTDYLARWELEESEPEMPWDSAARIAVENALENADWDDNIKTITLFNPDDERIRKTVTSREELEEYLQEEARVYFYANAPRDDGEFVFDCDENDIVETALMPYEERLAEFFQDSDE